LPVERDCEKLSKSDQPVFQFKMVNGGEQAIVGQEWSFLIGE